MGPKKKAAKTPAKPADAAGSTGPPVTEEPPPVAFTPAEAKKLAKLLKTSDRSKRLDAIRVVSENHGYIATGGCLLPLVESMVAKKKTEEVVRAASQVLLDYLIGRDAGADPKQQSDSALAVLQEAKKKPAKYKLAEVLTLLVLNPDPGNSWNATRSLRSLAATVDSIPKGSSQAASLGAMLLGPGQPTERLCSYLIAQEAKMIGTSVESTKGGAGDDSSVVPWQEVRLNIIDIVGVMCKVSNEAIQTVVSTGTVRCMLGLLRSVTESEIPDMPLLASTLVVLFAVAKLGGGGIILPTGAVGDNNSVFSFDAPPVAVGGGTGGSVVGGGGMSPELTALAEGGAWGTVYDALKGPCMARAAELQQTYAAGNGGKKGGEEPTAMSADLAACLDNMARCAEVLRVMAITGAGLEEEGALEAGVAAMSSILGMSGLPREQSAVANLMTGIVKAMGSIACLSESNRVKVCSVGAAEKVLALMAPPDVPPPSGTVTAATSGGGGSSPPDTPHGRLMRKTAEKCLHHLLVSRVTWMADDRALCDTRAPFPDEHEKDAATTTEAAGGAVATGATSGAATAAATAGGDNEGDVATALKHGRRRSTSGGSNRSSHPTPAPGPAYLAVEDVLAATNAGSIDVRCRAVRLLSRLMSSPRCAATLGVSAVPILGQFIEWWLRNKDNPETDRTPRPAEPTLQDGGSVKSPASPSGGGVGKKVAGGKAAAKESAAAAAAAEANKDEQSAEEKAAAAKEAWLTAKRLEETDSTRVLRDEALAYALVVLLKLAETGCDERAAIGENSIVELLTSVLKRMPCTPEEFFTNSGEQWRPMTGTVAPGSTDTKPAPTTTLPVAISALGSLPSRDGKNVTNKLTEESSSEKCVAPSHSTGGGLSESRPDTTLDLSLAHRRPSFSCKPRRLCCWRGEKSRDPEVPLFSPLDWGWDFEVGVSQEPIQPGLVLRAAALRVLLAVVDGYNPDLDTTSADEAAGGVPAVNSRGGAAAAAAAEAAAEAAVLSGVQGARSVLGHVLPICLDLLSVDVCHDIAGTDGDVGETFGGYESSRYRRQGDSMREAAIPPQRQQGQQQQREKDGNNEESEKSTKKRLTVEILLGRPVSPAEELVHEEIRVACLRLLGSLLRLGPPAREALLSTAAIHRGGGFKHLEQDNADSFNEQDWSAHADAKSAGSHTDKVAATLNVADGEVRRGEPQAWVKPQSFLCWNLNQGIDLPSLRASLPYVRTLSVVILPLRNPDAPITDIMAALVALKRLCRENENEIGGTKPELFSLSTDIDETSPLPSSRESTVGVLVDILAGVAVSLGALVPLVSIWGCALAEARSPVELAPEITGMVSECQALIDYLISRGHVRESFWSSLPSLEQIDEAKAAVTEASTPKKTPRKSKISSGKPGKGGGKGPSPAAAVLEMEDGETSSTVKAPQRPAGRPDPNLGPDRAGWGELLNARVDERRTQTCGTTALLMAATTGLETAVANLLLARADPNVVGSDGRTPLMCALAQGMEDAVRGLVEAGADVDAINRDGYSVLRCAFLCPSRQAMRNVMRKRSGAEAVVTRPLCSAASGRTGLPGSATSGRRGSRSSFDGGSSSGRVERRGSTPRSVSRSRSRSRSRSGSLTRDRRRSLLSRSISFGEGALGIDTEAGPGTGSSHRRLSRMASLSALDSARAALRDSSRRESARPLKTPRGTTVVRGDARMVPYILECGADPNVSSGTGDFPLHWAVTGTEITVRIMNQNIKIVAGGCVGETDGKIGAVGTAGKGGCAGTDAAAVASEDSTSGSTIGSTASTETSTEGNGGSSKNHEEDLALLRVLVEAGSYLDACTPEGMTALHAAVIVGRVSLATALLDAGASPNYSDSLGCLPLHYACLRANAGYAELAKRLLALGMGRPLDKGVHKDLRKGKTRREKILLDVADIMNRGLREATEPSSITQHRATRSELLNFVSAEGFTPLHYVCDGRVAGRHAVAAVLSAWQERAPTAAAAPAAIPMLVGGDSRGVSGRGSAHANTDEDSSFPVDSSLDRVKILQWLLSEPAVDAKVRVPRGATTLHMAAALPGSNGADLVRMLIRNGGVNLDALDSPAAISCGGHVESEYGFGHQFCATSVQDESNGGGQGAEPQLQFSALHYALDARSWECAKILLSAGASVGPEGAYPTCLHVACLASAPVPLVEMLLERDSRLSGTILSGIEAGPYGATPLFIAAAVGSADLVDLLLPGRGKLTGTPQALDDIAEDDTAQLIGAGGDDGGASAGEAGAGASEDIWIMTHSPSDGRSPLHAAAAGGHTAAARALLNAEPELAAITTAASGGSSSTSWLNIRDTEGNTPLDLAVSKGHWECAERLAAAAPFDVRLAVDKGPSSALSIVERANMAIVDEGLGDTSSLCALRESNTLVMILLKRLHDEAAAADAELAAASSALVEAAVVAPSVEVGNPTTDLVQGPAQNSDAVDDASPQQQEHDKKEGADDAELVASDAVVARTAPSEAVSRSTPFPIIHHLHPCFAEGVLYSNAKGIFIPDTAERKKKRRSSEHQQRRRSEGDAVHDKHSQAAVIIQSRARQAFARRAVAERRQQVGRDTPSYHHPEPGAAERDKKALIGAETTRRREDRMSQNQQRRSSRSKGEVGVVVVKAAG